MREALKLISKFLELEKPEQEKLIDLARKDASKKKGEMNFWVKWSFVHIGALVVTAFLAGFGIAALFHVFRSESPTPTTVAVVMGVGFAMLWPYAQRVISVYLLESELRARLDVTSI